MRAVKKAWWALDPRTGLTLLRRTGMAAVLSGTIHIPLTAIFLIAEITGGYALFVPLMIVSSLSYVVSRWLIPYSVYTRDEQPARP